MTKVVYISFNSASEPLVDSQVLSYLKRLNTKDYKFILVTAENIHTKDNTREIRKKFAAAGIEWMPVFKGKLGTFGQILKMKRQISKINGVALVHARSYFSGVVAYLVFRAKAIPYIYDIRGFWVDEKVYKNRLKYKSMMYKVLKWLDNKIYLHASGLVSLTQKAQEIIREFDFFKQTKPLIKVIPTCVDTDVFMPLERRVDNVVYLGSVGQGYMGTVIFNVFALFQQYYPEIKITLISRSQKSLIKKLAQDNNVDLSRIEHLSLNHNQVATSLGKCTIGLSFIMPHFSKKASCATKIGEYLACGMPVLCNRGVGDMDEVLSSDVAVLCDDFSPDELLKAVNEVVSMSKSAGCQKACQKLAKSYFSLEGGVVQYNELYTALLEQNR